MTPTTEQLAALERLRIGKYGPPIFIPLQILSRQMMEDLATIRDLALAQNPPDAEAATHAATIARLERELAELKLKYEWASRERQQYWEQLAALRAGEGRT